jgi:hypothetical protein
MEDNVTDMQSALSRTNINVVSYSHLAHWVNYNLQVQYVSKHQPALTTEIRFQIHYRAKFTLELANVFQEN